MAFQNVADALKAKIADVDKQLVVSANPDQRKALQKDKRMLEHALRSVKGAHR